MIREWILEEFLEDQEEEEVKAGERAFHRTQKYHGLFQKDHNLMNVRTQEYHGLFQKDQKNGGQDDHGVDQVDQNNGVDQLDHDQMSQGQSQ